jgi:hypothetical protein
MVPALTSTVCASGSGSAGDRQAVLADPPTLTERVTRRAAQPSQIVEPDRRVGPGQINIGVQIAQHTVAEGVRQERSLSVQAGELTMPVLLDTRRSPDFAACGDGNRTRCYQNEIRDAETVRR